VHLHRAEPDALVGLLSLDDADHLLTSTAIRTPSIRMARDGAVLPESAYTRSATLAGKPLTGLVDGRKALDLFHDGATVVFQGLQRYWPPLTRLVAELELELGHPCQANAYLTPPGSQGFAVHADSHDVFVFQTAGSKLWEVHGQDGPEEVLLEPGLSMYLPTGTPHAARAQQTVSLHVTVGINQLTWRGLVERTLRQVLTEVPDSHLPAGYLDDPALLVDGLADRLAALADAVREVDARAAVEAEIRRFLTSRPPRLPGGLHDALADVTETTQLRRRPGHPCVLLDRGATLEVLLGDRSMTVPAWLRPALDEIRSRTELRPADLPLDPQSNLVLCRRLVREGLLAIA
jgi:mannose-6-phosphate isomerase-like protein (cupin superfamily)